MSAGLVNADEMLHPASECLRLESVPAAAFHPVQAAPALRFDLQRPVWAVRLRATAAATCAATLSRASPSTIGMTMNVYGHLFPRGDDTAELAAAAAHLFVA
jgi:hypothetical protein